MIRGFPKIVDILQRGSAPRKIRRVQPQLPLRLVAVFHSVFLVAHSRLLFHIILVFPIWNNHIRPKSAPYSEIADILPFYMYSDSQTPNVDDKMSRKRKKVKKDDKTAFRSQNRGFRREKS